MKHVATKIDYIDKLKPNSFYKSTDYTSINKFDFKS